MYYSIVMFGTPTYGDRRIYYRSFQRAQYDAQTLGGGTLTTVRIVACETRKQAINADISGPEQVVWTR